jgi:hypothetical protein
LVGPGIEIEVEAANLRGNRPWYAGIFPTPYLVPVPLIIPEFGPGGKVVPPRPFRITVVFYEAEPGFTFDPGRAVLMVSHGEKRSPVRYEGCGDQPRELDPPIGLPPDPFCIFLVFDMDPPPATQEFSLLLEGLDKNGTPFPVPPIVFRRVWFSNPPYRYE